MALKPFHRVQPADSCAYECYSESETSCYILVAETDSSFSDLLDYCEHIFFNCSTRKADVMYS